MYVGVVAKSCRLEGAFGVVAVVELDDEPELLALACVVAEALLEGVDSTPVLVSAVT